MANKKRKLVRLLVLLGLVGLVLRPTFCADLVARCVWAVGSALQTPTAMQGDDVDASGVISATEISLSPIRGGRVAALYAAEGDQVKTGQELALFDTELLQAQIAVAQADVAVAQAALQQMEAGARPGALACASLRVEQAKAAHEVAQQGLTDAQALRAEQQELDMRIAVGEIQVAAAEYHLQSALSVKDAAELAKGMMEYTEDQIRGWAYPVPPPQLPEELRSALWDWWKAWVGVNTAKVNLDDAKARLEHLRTVREKPQELDAEVDMAGAGIAQAMAALDAAQAELHGLKAGAGAEQLDVARARVEQAQAALEALQAQHEEMVMRAPMDATVLSRAAHVGEVLAPGSKLFSLADLSEVKLTVYVTENRLGEIALHQRVVVTVDAFPGRSFEGRVTHIASQAEYTPRSVATKEERVNTVYAVEIRLRNAERLLKPGMPADAQFATTEEQHATGRGVQLNAVTGPDDRVLAIAPLELSGMIQAEEIRIASEVQGYAAQVLVEGGDVVAQGEPLLMLKSSVVQASVHQASVAVQAAQAELQGLRAAPRSEEVAGKRAQLAMATAKQDRAHVAWQSALRALREPQELDEQILTAETQVALAAQSVQLAEAEHAQARSKADAAAWGSSERQALEIEEQAAEAQVAAARADERAAQVALQYLRAIREKPLALQTKANAAEGQYRVDTAAMRVVQAELDDLLAGATASEVSVAEANLAAAQAELRLAQIALERLTVRAPTTGTVVSRMVDVGETVLAGATLLTLADLSALHLTVYVPESQVGSVRLAQRVDVTVDTFPERCFEGQVVHISDQPQYTPRNVATKEGRVNTVYGVKIRLPNPEGLLKPGMAGDAVFRP